MSPAVGSLGLPQIGGKGKVFLLNAIPGLTGSIESVRRASRKASTPPSKRCRHTSGQFPGDQNQGTAIVSAVLQANPDLAGIFAEDTINGRRRQ
jgi:ABC-type sugar transport system substrate-binding protein